jgi:hypothetical protein
MFFGLFQYRKGGVLPALWVEVKDLNYYLSKQPISSMEQRVLIEKLSFSINV